MFRSQQAQRHAAQLNTVDKSLLSTTARSDLTIETNNQLPEGFELDTSKNRVAFEKILNKWVYERDVNDFTIIGLLENQTIDVVISNFQTITTMHTNHPNDKLPSAITKLDNTLKQFYTEQSDRFSVIRILLLAIKKELKNTNESMQQFFVRHPDFILDLDITLKIIIMTIGGKGQYQSVNSLLKAFSAFKLFDEIKALAEALWDLTDSAKQSIANSVTDTLISDAAASITLTSDNEQTADSVVSTCFASTESSPSSSMKHLINMGNFTSEISRPESLTTTTSAPSIVSKFTGLFWSSITSTSSTSASTQGTNSKSNNLNLRPS